MVCLLLTIVIMHFSSVVRLKTFNIDYGAFPCSVYLVGKGFPVAKRKILRTWIYTQSMT